MKLSQAETENKNTFRMMLFSIIGQLGNSCLEKCLSTLPTFHWIYNILLSGMVLWLPFASIIQFTGYLPFLEIQYSLKNGKSYLKLISLPQGQYVVLQKSPFLLIKKKLFIDSFTTTGQTDLANIIGCALVPQPWLSICILSWELSLIQRML